MQPRVPDAVQRVSGAPQIRDPGVAKSMYESPTGARHLSYRQKYLIPT